MAARLSAAVRAGVCFARVFCLRARAFTMGVGQGDDKGEDAEKPEAGRGDKEGEDEGQKEDKDGAGEWTGGCL